MVCKVDGGNFKSVTLSSVPSCVLFHQTIADGNIHVRYTTPATPLVPADPLQDVTLSIPLEPELEGLARQEIDLHRSKVMAYRMGSNYDAWFTACFGFDAVLVYIGQERRPVLGTFSPRNPKEGENEGWLAFLWKYIFGSQPEPDWLTFTDLAPVLVTSDESLKNVDARLPTEKVDMLKFRPNIVVSGENPFDEDYWSELAVNGQNAITLTKLCGRCVSLNVDYDTGLPGQGERGTLLKKLMADRRVDTGAKYQPCFGCYGFLSDGLDSLHITVGDDVNVVKRTEERPVWDWPGRDKKLSRFYRYR